MLRSDSLVPGVSDFHADVTRHLAKATQREIYSGSCPQGTQCKLYPLNLGVRCGSLLIFGFLFVFSLGIDFRFTRWISFRN